MRPFSPTLCISLRMPTTRDRPKFSESAHFWACCPHSPHTNTKSPNSSTLLGVIFYAYLIDKGWSKRRPPRVRKNDLGPLGIQIGKGIFNQPPGAPGHGRDNRQQRSTQAGRLVLAAGAFLQPYKVRAHYRGAVRRLFLLCRLFIECSIIQCIYGVFEYLRLANTRWFCKFVQFVLVLWRQKRLDWYCLLCFIPCYRFSPRLCCLIFLFLHNHTPKEAMQQKCIYSYMSAVYFNCYIVISSSFKKWAFRVWSIYRYHVIL